MNEDLKIYAGKEGLFGCSNTSDFSMNFTVIIVTDTSLVKFAKNRDKLVTIISLPILTDIFFQLRQLGQLRTKNCSLLGRLTFTYVKAPIPTAPPLPLH